MRLLITVQLFALAIAGCACVVALDLLRRAHERLDAAAVYTANRIQELAPAAVEYTPSPNASRCDDAN